MSKDLYFNNDNIPPGQEDPGNAIEPPSKKKYQNIQDWMKEKEWFFLHGGKHDQTKNYEEVI